MADIAESVLSYRRKNEGELPQYYVSNNHESIIDPWLFNYVQEQLQKRTRTKEHRYSGIGYLNSKIFCAKCGAAFGPRPWHSTSYNNIVWQCRNRYSDVKCKTVNVYDNLLFYVLHDVARKKIAAKDIRTEIVEFAADVISSERPNAIKQYMADFETMFPWAKLCDIVTAHRNRVLARLRCSVPMGMNGAFTKRIGTKK